MDFAITTTLVYLPPILVAGLIALYRNNILCFWDCHPAGKAIVQTMSTAKQTAVMIRNTVFQLMSTVKGSMALMLQGLHSTALMLFRTIESMRVQIVTTIQGILVALQAQFELMQVNTVMFFYRLYAKFRSMVSYAVNETAAFATNVTSFFSPSPQDSSRKMYLYAGLAVGICVVLVTWYYLTTYRSAKLPLQEKKAIAPILEPIKVPAEEKKPIRRRSRRT